MNTCQAIFDSTSCFGSIQQSNESNPKFCALKKSIKSQQTKKPTKFSNQKRTNKQSKPSATKNKVMMTKENVDLINTVYPFQKLRRIHDWIGETNSEQIYPHPYILDSLC